jgi:hypothetical protein
MLPDGGPRRNASTAVRRYRNGSCSLPIEEDQMGDGRDRDQLNKDIGADPPQKDSVETRDSATRQVPRQSSTLWMYVIPALALLIAGGVWMVESELGGTQTNAPFAAIGTSGERAKGNDPEGARADEPLNAVPEGPRVISDEALLSSKGEYVGRTVRFDAIPVFSQKGPRTFWVGRVTDRALVLLDQGAGAVQLKRGEMVSLEGQFERTTGQSADGLSKEDREAVQGEDVIIRATRVKPVQSAGAGQAAIPESDK